ncbi:Endoribonuclease L-PSP [Salmonella enterica subsp. enterica]|nr:Endoribonuclease L-PSP [Salmonella enterica subsp. enterica] [Salmonella enterica subsp. enterica serovar Menston]
MSKTIATENAPAAIGPYVQGVDLGSMVITSGQIPVDPKTGGRSGRRIRSGTSVAGKR